MPCVCGAGFRFTGEIDVISFLDLKNVLAFRFTYKLAMTDEEREWEHPLHAALPPIFWILVETISSTRGMAVVFMMDMLTHIIDIQVCTVKVIGPGT